MLFYLALTAALCSAALAQKCPYVECACINEVIDCSNRQLTDIPNRVDPGSSYTTLLLNGNQIGDISLADSLPVGLDTLDLRGNPIENFTSDAVNRFSQTLKIIRFQDPAFKVLPQSLELFDNLETLDIEGGSVTSFPDATMAKLAESVIDLRLVDLNLRGWPSFLDRFVFLRKLALDDNTRLGNLPDGSFDLWRNELTDLSLSNTGISSIAPVSVCTKLENLNVARNKITDPVALSFDLIPLASSLETLDASYNGLTGEPRLAELSKLREIYLGHNKIAAGTAGALPPSARIINLDNNLFPEIPDFLTTVPLAQNVSLKSNQISTVGLHDFAVSSRLESLYLGGNPISYVDEFAFNNIRSYLTYIDLAGTKLTRLPLALKSLTRLQTLWMPNNSDLICTCEEKALATWISSLPSMRVVGQCGSVDIKEFVGQLAQLCP